MKYRPLTHFAPCMVATAIALAVASANGQGHEHIVGGQVVSDTAVAGHCDHYVGDMPMSDACGCVSTIHGRTYGRPDLFYNYYTQGCVNRVNAQMYLSPLPVPPNVGHTFFTYQPFYPHELLYAHKNRFHHNYDNGRGINRTRAVYYSPPIRQAASNLYWNYLRLPR